MQWLKYGFLISYIENYPSLTPATCNHMGAMQFPEAVNAYFEKEIHLRATMGPFMIPPFLDRIGISPISSRKKRDSEDRWIILDLSWPIGNSVNDGIDKHNYCRCPVELRYPTVDTLAKRIFELGKNCKIWKKDLS